MSKIFTDLIIFQNDYAKISATRIYLSKFNKSFNYDSVAGIEIVKKRTFLAFNMYFLRINLTNSKFENFLIKKKEIISVERFLRAYVNCRHFTDN